MKRVENINAPSLNGAIVAAMLGLIALVVSRVVGGFDWTTSGFFGLMVAVVAGVVLVLPWGQSVPAPAAEGEGHGHGDGHGTAAAPAAAPIVTPAAAPAAASSAPAAAAPVVAAVADSRAHDPVAAPEAATSAPEAAAAAAPAAANPVAAPDAATSAPADAGRPAALAAPRDGVGDDLKTLEGIGPALEKLCHDLGIYHFDQIAAWGPAEVAWMDSNLKGFKGRVTRDKWVSQAKIIVEAGVEEFLRRAKTNDY